MTVISLAIMPADDPNGTPLVTLTDADISTCELRVGENELGGGKFTIRRDHASATAANLAAGNYVKVTIPVIDTDPVMGFWLDEHDDTILARDEEGGEYLTRSGPGSLAILGRAALLDQFYNGPLGGTNRGNYNVPGYWTWETEPYGAILVRLHEEGTLQPGFPLVETTIDFTRTQDSNSNAWPDIEELIQIPIGTDGLATYARLVASGNLFVTIDPGLAIHGYGTSQGVDRTSASFASGKVRLAKGVNIQTELARRASGMQSATHAIVTGKDYTYRQVVSPSFSPGDAAKWINVNFQESNDPDLLDDVGGEDLRKRATLLDAVELEILPGVDDTIGQYLPWLHFLPGDLVTLDTGSGTYDYDEHTAKLVGFRVVLGEASRDDTDLEEARSLRVIVELNGSRTAGFSDTKTAHALGDCPFFVDHGTNADGRSMKMRDTGDGKYTQIHAADSSATRVAWLEANVSTDAYVYLFASNTDGDPEDFCEITMGGEGTLEIKGGRQIEMTVSNGDAFKHYFFGGSGIVLPSLASDPSTGGQAGQVYWNTTDDLARVHDGTSWVDLGGGGGGTPLDYLADDDSTLSTPGVRFAGSFGGDDATYIGAKGGTSGRDAALDMRAEVGNANFDLFTKESTANVDIFGDGTAGELYLTTTGLTSISATVIDLTAAGGLRVPRMTSDPGSPVDGTIWYRTDTDKLRLRAAGVTVDLN
jgi:hypothetical protein